MRLQHSTVNFQFKKVYFSFRRSRVVWFKKDLFSESKTGRIITNGFKVADIDDSKIFQKLTKVGLRSSLHSYLIYFKHKYIFRLRWPIWYILQKCCDQKNVYIYMSNIFPSTLKTNKRQRSFCHKKSFPRIKSFRWENSSWEVSCPRVDKQSLICHCSLL